jgi:hypothetical protein
VLCHKHNTALGLFGDDPALLRQAADYIETWRAKITPRAAPRPIAAKRGEGHQAWKGEEAGYTGKRLRIWRALGSADHCANREVAGCTSAKYEWTLPPGAEAGKPENYRSLCASCRRQLQGLVGGGHPNAKLTDEQAAEVRRLYATGMRTQKSLADQFGVSQPMISTVIRRTTYKTPA